MKKTLTLMVTALCASSVASAVMDETDYTDYTVTIDFTAQQQASFNNNHVYVPAIGSITQDAPFGLISDSVTLSASGSGTAADPTLNGYTKELLIAGYNVGGGATVVYNLTFTAVCDSTLSEVKLALITFTSVGNTQGSKTVKYAFGIAEGTVAPALDITNTTLTKELATTGMTDQNKEISSLTYNFADDTINPGSGAILGLSDLDFDLLSGHTYTMSIALARETQEGFYVGLGGVQMKGLVPEPATGTLSVLALAGLAARRRRKR